MVVVVEVACCCSIPLRLALMPVLTFAPCTLTYGTNTSLTHMVVSPIAPCAGGTYSLSHWYKYTTCTHGDVNICKKLALVVFHLPTTCTNNAHTLKQLCVVVICGGGGGSIVVCACGGGYSTICKHKGSHPIQHNIQYLPGPCFQFIQANCLLHSSLPLPFMHLHSHMPY